MTLDEKIQEISLDAKQAEQISVLFDVGFEMGFVFAESGHTKRKDPNYQHIRKLYIEAASPVMVKMFEDVMKEYEKRQK